jgi:hypothetical protein
MPAALRFLLERGGQKVTRLVTLGWYNFNADAFLKCCLVPVVEVPFLSAMDFLDLIRTLGYYFINVLCTLLVSVGDPDPEILTGTKSESNTLKVLITNQKR